VKTSQEKASENMVRLIPMSESDYQKYLADAVNVYAQEHVRAGNWHPSEALQKSEKSFRQLLPQGLASNDQYLYSILDPETDTKIGMIWFAVMPGPPLLAFINDFRIDDGYRRRGHGTSSLRAIEEKAKELGIDTISLHVFGHNQAAIALYQKMGYHVTDMVMAKKLDS
jgi:ribosomal protein S18 acetylase RimI-like enzyme